MRRTHRTPNRTARLWSRILLILSLMGTGYLLWQGREDLQNSVEIGLPILGALVTLQLVYLASQSERLRLIVADHAQNRVSGIRWMRIFFLGRLLNSVLVQSGNAYRFIALRRDFGVSASRFASSLTAQTWLSAVSAFAVAAIFSVPARSEFGLGQYTPLILTALAASSLAAPFLARPLSRYMAQRQSKGRLMRAVDGIIERTTQTVASSQLVLMLGVTVLVTLVTGVAILVLAYQGAGVDLPWYLAAALLALLQLSNVIVLTPGNLGIQELGFAALSGLIGYSGAVGVIASAAVRVSGLLAVALGAGVAEVILRVSTTSQSADSH